MSNNAHYPCAPSDDDKKAAVLQTVEDQIQQDDWGRLLLRNFYIALTSPTYRHAATIIGVTPGTVTKRINSLQELLTEQSGVRVVLVVAGDRGPELTALGEDVIDALEPSFSNYRRER